MFKLLSFNHNAPAYKNKNQNFLVIFSPNSSLLVTMAKGNKLGKKNMDKLFLGDYGCTLKISAKSETMRAQPPI